MKRGGKSTELDCKLLAQMSGMDTKGSNKYLILATTNLPWSIDTAMRRAGRFDNSIFIPEPDLATRKRLFEINLTNKPVSKKESLDELAKKTAGFASAEISQICKDAARIPLREAIKKNSRREITKADFEQVIGGMKTILASWYPKALKELVKGGEQEAFKDLVDAGMKYRRN